MNVMQKFFTIAVAALALAGGLTAAVAQGKGKGGSPLGMEQGSSPPNWDKGQRKGWKDGKTPPGWTNEQGQRKGWDGQDVPPGWQTK
jgi:hypothetical protein